jgi:MFS family permease
MGMSIQNVESAKRSTETGMHQAVYGFGMFGGSALSGVIADLVGIRLMFVIVSIICGFAGLFVHQLSSQTNPVFGQAE